MADILANYRKAASRAAAGSAIKNLAQQAGVLMYQNDQVNIIESQKAADADILQNTIDPDRQRNDAAYAGAVLRNNLNKQYNIMDTELDNPASEYSRMDPEEFAGLFTNLSKKFYSENAKSKNGNILANVYANATYSRQNSLIAKQAKAYKDQMKTNLANQAVIALSSLPEGAGEDFELNTTALIEQMLPDDVFLDSERAIYIMAAATTASKNKLPGSSTEADRRLLDFAQKYYNSAELMQQANDTAEATYAETSDRLLDEQYFNWATTRELAADAGTYTDEQWVDDISDPEKVDRWSVSRINRWHNTSLSVQGDSDGLDAAIWKFKARVPMGTEKESVRQEAMAAVQDELAQKVSAGEMTTAEAYDTYASYLEKQASVDTALKYKVESQLANATFTPQAVTSADFQDALTIVSALEHRLGESQLLKQIGEVAWSNYQLWDSLMVDAGGDPEKAAQAYADQQKAKAALGADYDASLTRQIDYEALGSAAEDIMTSKDKNDPNSRAGIFGLGSATGGAFSQQEITAHLKEKTLEHMRRTGQGFSDALEWAQKVVGTEFKAFGNEKQYTGGVSMVDMLGLPAGTQESASDDVWEYFCNMYGVDPDKVHGTLSGGDLVLLNADGSYVDGMPSISLTALGTMWQEEQDIKAEAKAATNEADRIVKTQRRNRQFAIRLESIGQEAGRPLYNNSTPLWPQGPTLGQYKDANMDQRTAWRKEYRSRSFSVARTSLAKFDAWVKKDTEWRRAMGFTWGASTMQEK